jgi:hypothetical protein
MIVGFQKQYHCSKCNMDETYDSLPLSSPNKICSFCKGHTTLVRITPMKALGVPPADLNLSAIDLRSKLRAKNEAFVKKNLKPCIQCGIRTFCGQWCDVCDTMYKAVMVQPGLRTASELKIFESYRGWEK